jgi:lysophospholipid acyltransferase (LPLAT)-like uncharacterized protein
MPATRRATLLLEEHSLKQTKPSRECFWHPSVRLFLAMMIQGLKMTVMFKNSMIEIISKRF